MFLAIFLVSAFAGSAVAGSCFSCASAELQYAWHMTGSAVAGSCFSCASAELQYAWHMTGLPTRPSTGQYTAMCATPITMTDNKYKVSCDGACMTYYFEIMKADGVTASDTKMFVRGCHERLTSTNSNQRISQDYCESGTVGVYNAEKKYTSLKRVVKFCTSLDCNKLDASAITGKACTNKPGQSKVPTKCIQCDSDSNCKSSVSNAGTCSATRWCQKTKVEIGEKKGYVKSCSPVNPFGTEACRSSTSAAYMEPYHLSVEKDNCYCMNDDCNGAAVTTFSLLGLAFSALFAYLVRQ